MKKPLYRVGEKIIVSKEATVYGFPAKYCEIPITIEKIDSLGYITRYWYDNYVCLETDCKKYKLTKLEKALL